MLDPPTGKPVLKNLGRLCTTLYKNPKLGNTFHVLVLGNDIDLITTYSFLSSDEILWLDSHYIPQIWLEWLMLFMFLFFNPVLLLGLQKLGLDTTGPCGTLVLDAPLGPGVSIP